MNDNPSSTGGGLTAELVVDGRAPQTPALAPNGQLLCYVFAPISRTGDHIDTELWLVDTDGGAAARRVTTDTAAESRPRWSADSGTLFFLSDRADRGTSQVYRLTLADGAATAVTNWRADIVDHLPLADPNLVALLAQDEPTEQDERRARDRDDAIVAPRLHRSHPTGSASRHRRVRSDRGQPRPT